MFAGKYLIQENTNLPKSGNPIYSQTAQRSQPDQTDDESLWRSINSALIMNSILSTPYRGGEGMLSVFSRIFACGADWGREGQWEDFPNGTFSQHHRAGEFQWRIRTWRTSSDKDGDQPGEWRNNDTLVRLLSESNNRVDTPIISLRFAIKSMTKCICVLRKQLLVLLSFVCRSVVVLNSEFSAWCRTHPGIQCSPQRNATYERTSWRFTSSWVQV